MKATFYFLALFAAFSCLQVQAQQADSTAVAFKIDTETLDSYAGEYQMAVDRIINITHEGNKLYLKPPNQAEKVLFLPKTKTRFYNQLNSAEIVFNHNEEGVVVSLTIFNGRGSQRTIMKR